MIVSVEAINRHGQQDRYGTVRTSWCYAISLIGHYKVFDYWEISLR